jgi:hypothetical protein
MAKPHRVVEHLAADSIFAGSLKNHVFAERKDLVYDQVAGRFERWPLCHDTTLVSASVRVALCRRQASRTAATGALPAQAFFADAIRLSNQL